jgi:hypothetical protein
MKTATNQKTKFGVEVWHGTTQVYVYCFNDMQSAEAYRLECLNDHERRAYGWNRYVSDVMTFEDSSAYLKYAEENEGGY